MAVRHAAQKPRARTPCRETFKKVPKAELYIIKTRHNSILFCFHTVLLYLKTVYFFDIYGCPDSFSYLFVGMDRRESPMGPG